LGGKGRTALVALPGERGAGKSQLAAAYARQCIRDGYDLVAWINAESARSRGWRCWPRICTWPAGGADTEAAAAAVCRWDATSLPGGNGTVTCNN
jgi:hypothetical protein